MFEDLTDEQLTQLRIDCRTQYQNLVMGKATQEIRYGEMGEKFHPADAKALESFLAQVNLEIRRREGCGAGGFTIVTR